MARGKRQQHRQNYPRYPAYPRVPRMQGMGSVPATFMRQNNQMIRTTTGVVIGAAALGVGIGVLGTITGGWHP